MTDGVVIFDGDDTLWETEILYDEARDDAAALVAATGIDRHLRRPPATDRRPQRRPARAAQGAFSDVQRRGLPGAGRTARRRRVRHVADEVFRASASVFQRPPRWSTAPPSVLGELRRRHDLALLRRVIQPFSDGGSPRAGSNRSSAGRGGRGEGRDVVPPGSAEPGRRCVGRMVGRQQRPLRYLAGPGGGDACGVGRRLRVGARTGGAPSRSSTPTYGWPRASDRCRALIDAAAVHPACEGLNVARPDDRPTTSGISFVDILFALAVGEVLAPSCRGRPAMRRAPPAPIVWNLAVALVLILTSFIGYHNSQNRPLFTVRFVNVSLCKFVLDISTVIVYFLFASYAVVSPAQTQTLLLLVVLVFGLYLLWDTTSWYEKKRTELPNRVDDGRCRSGPAGHRRWRVDGVRLPAGGGDRCRPSRHRRSVRLVAAAADAAAVTRRHRRQHPGDRGPLRLPDRQGQHPVAYTHRAGGGLTAPPAAGTLSTSSTGTGTTTAPPPSEGSP